MIIQVKDLVCKFGDTHALDGITLDIEKGEVVVIIGPSGSGKSTLLRCLNAIELQETGEVIIDGIKVEKNQKNIHKIRLEVGMVFQQFNLFPHLTVIDNIMLAQRVVRKRSSNESRQKGMELLGLVDLSDKIDSFPAQLSGGQKQRVAIARALAMDPMIMLFDEVTSALDPEMVGEVLDVINKLADKGKTMLIATHVIGFAREVADRIIFIENGKIIEDGIPDEIFDNPKHQRTKDFLSKVL
ncbi:MAG: amino acid ABC transporter ATP-binding protein [candidate division Zixibacteria bacterium]|nr:amino acid ABC transporter ATP-binding protein [candidate division Zixibacteria bacterium]